MILGWGSGMMRIPMFTFNGTNVPLRKIGLEARVGAEFRGKEVVFKITQRNPYT